MHEVIRYVKNHNLGFTIPYTITAKTPVRTRTSSSASTDGQGRSTRLTLIIEVTGEKKKDKEAKVDSPTPLGSGGEQPRALRPLGVRRDHRPLGRPNGDPGPPANRVGQDRAA